MEFILREATMEDAETVLAWRNDKQTRDNSFTKDEIDLKSHLEWYRRKLNDDNCFLYILMAGEERVGQVRIDRINDLGEISYMIAPGKRGLGYGKKIIELCEEVPNGGVKALAGLVEKHNMASIKCFRANDYTEIAGGEMNCYIKFV